MLAKDDTWAPGAEWHLFLSTQERDWESPGNNCSLKWVGKASLFAEPLNWKLGKAPSVKVSKRKGGMDPSHRPKHVLAEKFLDIFAYRYCTSVR